MRRSIDSKLDVKKLLQSATEGKFMPYRTSRAHEADEMTAYIMEMIVELAVMADAIPDKTLATRLRSVVLPKTLEELCSIHASDG